MNKTKGSGLVGASAIAGATLVLVIIGYPAVSALPSESGQGGQAGDAGTRFDIPTEESGETDQGEPGSEPVTLTGTGQQATQRFELNSGGYRSTLTHDGEDLFSAWLVDENGSEIDLVANQTGSANVSKTVGMESGTYSINIDDDGQWTVPIEQP